MAGYLILNIQKWACKLNPLGAQFILSIFVFINLYMFRATMGPSSGETTVFMRHLVLVILCGWLSGMQEHMLLHTRQPSTQNNKYQVSHKHSFFSWWWSHSRPKHVEIDEYKCTKNKLCTKLVLFTILYRDSWSKNIKYKNEVTNVILISCISVTWRRELSGLNM